MSNENDQIDEKSNEILSRLRGISSEEKTEIGKLKCRIDDQSRLIMMLKKRNDEYLLQNIHFDKHCQNLEREIDQLKDEIHQQSNKNELISELYSTIEQLKCSNQILIDKEQQNHQQIGFYQSKLKEEEIEKENIRENLLSIQFEFKSTLSIPIETTSFHFHFCSIFVLFRQNQSQTESRLKEFRQEIQRKVFEIQQKDEEIQRNQIQIDRLLIKFKSIDIFFSFLFLCFTKTRTKRFKN